MGISGSEISSPMSSGTSFKIRIPLSKKVVEKSKFAPENHNQSDNEEESDFVSSDEDNENFN